MEEPVATTNSGDQDERIRARRIRIEKRTVSRSEEGKKNKNADPEEKQKSKRKQQVANSLVRLDKKKASTIEVVTSLRVEADHDENTRRIYEEEKRQLRLHNLQGEALTSGKKNAAVEMRWAELMEYNMPLELNDEVEQQREACDDIIFSKDKLIKDFQRELKVKDDEYVKALKRQGEDIEQLLARMNSQYRELQSLYEEELSAIEDAFLQERTEIIDNNRSEIDSLFEKRRVMEMNYMEARQEQEANYQAELNDLRTRDAEDYNQLKIKLETDIQTLEQQLEEMRATYQLNTEKLEYNYRVLTERDMENSATLGQQKRKLARLKDALSTLMTKYHNTDAKFKQENMDLTEEYRRITKQYKDLQSKFRHFEIADNKRYHEVWDMHHEEIMESVQRLLAADSVITGQQLGFKWEPPSQEFLEWTASSMNNGKALGQNPDGASPTAGAMPGTKPNTTADGPSSSESSSSEESPESKSSNEKEKDSFLDMGLQQSKVMNAKVKHMLHLLSEEAGFLVDPKVREEIEGMEKDQASVYRAESILKALGIENEADLKSLIGYFYESVMDDEEDAFALERATDQASKLKSLGLKVKPDEVVRVAKKFVQDRNLDGEGETALRTSKRKSREDREDEEQRATDARRERERKEEIEYWNKLAQVVPDQTVRIWTALEQAFVKYNKVLSDRTESIQDIQSLKSQNEELKNLLNNYLGSQVVKDLLIPPLETVAFSGLRSPQSPVDQDLYRN